MSTPQIPDDIRRYLIQRVPSVPYIEAVLLMRADRQLAWAPGTLGRRLYLDESAAATLLSRLERDGIAGHSSAEPPGYRYGPVSSELEDLWDRIAVVYTRHLIEISTLIHTKSSGKAQLLADAFVWRKEN